MFEPSVPEGTYRSRKDEGLPKRISALLKQKEKEKKGTSSPPFLHTKVFFLCLNPVSPSPSLNIGFILLTLWFVPLLGAGKFVLFSMGPYFAD